jgi:hypothetical protein
MRGFEARIVDAGLDGYRMTVIYLPDRLVEELQVRGKLRCKGKIGAARFAGAWMPSRGRWYLMVSRALLERSGYRAGDLAMVWFEVTPDDEVDVPEELAAALKAKKSLEKKWQALRPGTQRSFAYRVSSAKTLATRLRRVAEVVGWVEDEASRPKRG